MGFPQSLSGGEALSCTGDMMRTIRLAVFRGLVCEAELCSQSHILCLCPATASLRQALLSALQASGIHLPLRPGIAVRITELPTACEPLADRALLWTGMYNAGKYWRPTSVHFLLGQVKRSFLELAAFLPERFGLDGRLIIHRFLSSLG